MEKWWCFFDLWPLSSFLPLPSLKKGVAKKSLLYRVFLPPPFLYSSSNMKQQAPEQKKKPICATFLKPFCDQSTRKKKKKKQKNKNSAHPSENLDQKILWNPYFIERDNVDHLLTLQCGPLIDPKTPKMWTTYWPYSPYVYDVVLLSGPSFSFINYHLVQFSFSFLFKTCFSVGEMIFS